MKERLGRQAILVSVAAERARNMLYVFTHPRAVPAALPPPLLRDRRWDPTGAGRACALVRGWHGS